MSAKPQKHVAILGAGPAGLTAAYLLTKQGVRVTLLEGDPTYVGGISRTVHYKDFLFDIGGHRFFSKAAEVEALWSEILPNDFLDRPRSSRIYYRGRFFSYPLKAFEALWKLGFLESTLCVLSYAKARLLPVRNPRSFEDWVSNQFGKRLFGIFFRSYTEKVWGMSCKEISADWAAQRIKGLSLSSAIWNALIPKRKPKNRHAVIKTLIDHFRYPRKGPGMMWEVCAQKVQKQGGELRMGCRVKACTLENGHWTVRYDDKGREAQLQADEVISSIPLRELTLGLGPAVSESAKQAAGSLRYRDFITVALILKDRNLFQDNWIYIHEPAVKVGRVQNFKSWSPEMVPDQKHNCYGLEYFCFAGDGLWNSKDADLIALASRELLQLGLAQEGDILDGCVVRQPKAYPVYDEGYSDRVEAVRQELETRFPTLHVVGRNGMHKYNNQDHAMMTAMLTVKNILAGSRTYDVWRVNQDAEYHEEGDTGASALDSVRLTPQALPEARRRLG